MKKSEDFLSHTCFAVSKFHIILLKTPHMVWEISSPRHWKSHELPVYKAVSVHRQSCERHRINLVRCCEHRGQLLVFLVQMGNHVV